MMILSAQHEAITAAHAKGWPVDVAGIARAMGLEIYSMKLASGVSGVLTRSKDTQSGFLIYVNQDEPSYRQRFTAAHEIGHYVLHRNFIGQSLEDNYMLRAAGMSSAQETQANQFAADLLMPYDLINRAISMGYNTVEKLAEQFQVSKVAMSIRLGVPT